MTSDFARLLLVVSAILVLGQPMAARAQSGEKMPIPAEAAREEALKLIHDVYREGYETAKTDPQKVELAKKMLADASATASNPTSRYVLLRVAKDIAQQIGHLETVYAAIDLLTQHYQVDPLALKADALAAAARPAKLPAHYQGLTREYLQLVDEALEADRYDTIAGLREDALSTARNARDGDLMKATLAAFAQSEYQQQAAERIKQQFSLLDQQPTHPDANLAVGRYFCFVKNQWQKGIPMLALGSDPQLKALALLELTQQGEGLKIADQWWDIGEQLPEEDAKYVMSHAADHYQQAWPTLDGFARKRVDLRLAQYRERFSPPVGPFPAPLLVFTFEQDKFTQNQSTTLVADLSGGNNHGVLKGATSTEGRFGDGLSFDGKGTHVELPTVRNHLAADLSEITICCWVKNLGQGSGILFDVGFFAEKCLSLICADEGYNVHLAGTGFKATNLDTRQWRHVAAVWDGKEIRIYVDGGVRMTELHNGFTINSQTLSTNTAKLGRHARRDDAGRSFHGAMDEFAIFPAALSEKQVQDLYRFGLEQCLKK